MNKLKLTDNWNSNTIQWKGWIAETTTPITDIECFWWKYNNWKWEEFGNHPEWQEQDNIY